MDTPEYFSHRRDEILQFVPENSSNILEVGCSDGRFGELLRTKLKSKVTGIEINPEAAARANLRLDRVIVGTFENSLTQLADEKFDCIVCNDVLEHMYDPQSTIRIFKRFLKSDGVIVGSIPNVRYFPVLMQLVLNGEWTYTDFGVLDKTHLRFFTKKSIVRLFSDCGYKITKIKGINTTRSIKAKLISCMSFGKLEDCRHLQFAFVAAQHS